MEKAIKQMQREVEECAKEQRTLEAVNSKLVMGKVSLESAIDKATATRSQNVRSSISSIGSPKRKEFKEAKRQP